MNDKPKLRSSRDYSLFTESDTNRGINPSHARKLKKSMQEYGWIPAFPMLVHRTGKGLEVIDGQHRLSVAKELQLAVWFVELENGYDVARINAPQVPWKIADYGHSFANRGMSDYEEVVAFAEANGVTIGDAACLLAGNTCFSNIVTAWKSGNYKVTDREHAGLVAFLYTSIRKITRASVDKSLRLALIAIARIPGVDLRRLIRNSERLSERFVKFATREGALLMLEDVYNYGGRGAKIPLRTAAENAMRERSASTH